jgi:hypothetical protein
MLVQKKKKKKKNTKNLKLQGKMQIKYMDSRTGGGQGGLTRGVETTRCAGGQETLEEISDNREEQRKATHLKLSLTGSYVIFLNKKIYIQ